MEQTEYKIFIVLATTILMLFINGIIIFIFQYRKRKIVHDNEKKMLNEQHNHELLQTRVQIQEQTMQDIGREIHDNVGQRLTLASIYTNQLAFKNKYPEITERIKSIGNIINESLAELRSLSKTLTDTQVDATILPELLQDECHRVNALGLCQASVSVNGSVQPLPAISKNFTLRIVQEFLQNSLKHSGCKHINIIMTYSDIGITISIADDGNGFDVESTNANGIGLRNMRKRAGLIGAGFSITSETGKGTKLELSIPFSTGLNT